MRHEGNCPRKPLDLCTLVVYSKCMRGAGLGSDGDETMGATTEMRQYIGKLVALDIPFAHGKDRAHAKRAGFAFEAQSKLWAGKLSESNVGLVALLAGTPGLRFLTPEQYRDAYRAARS